MILCAWVCHGLILFSAAGQATPSPAPWRLRWERRRRVEPACEGSGGRMAAGMKDVASLAGVAVGTVSNVLNHPDLVRPLTRARVEAAMEQLGFIPNGSARQLRAGRSRCLGLVVLDVTNPFFTEVARGVEDYAGGRLRRDLVQLRRGR